jgi:hypothetical protein
MSDDDLLQKLERIAKAMEASAAAMKVSKAPPIWQIADIAQWIGKGYEHTRDRVVKTPSFPKQIPSGGWFSDDVIEWARLNRGKLRKAA